MVQVPSMSFLSVLTLASLLAHSTNAFTSSKIPTHLIKCYNNSQAINSHVPPSSQRTLVELIRRLEHNKTEPNIRLLSNAILHIAKFDGIQHSRISSDVDGVLPYRASGQQFFKYQLLVDHLTPDVGSELQFPRSLEDDEFCHLHSMISNTLDARRRNDEKYTCPMMRITKRDTSDISHRNYINSDFERSECPEQHGVMKTKWGHVSPGILVAGIASALQREQVPLTQLFEELKLKPFPYANQLTQTDNIDNIWMATLAGVLAQVVIQQASERPRILSPGRWNDTFLPRRFYLNGDHWDVNDADLLGAIDGLILASKVKHWLNTYPAASLSQLIDMYYSNRGIAYDRSVRACDRGAILAEILKQHNLINKISSATKLLNGFGLYDNVIDVRQIDKLAKAVAAEFINATDTLLPTYPDCQQDAGNIGRWEIILIADQTYSPYEIERLLAVLIEEADVSYYSSTIGLLSGNQAKWILNVTNDVLQTFTNFSTVPNGDWPTGLSLTRCLHEIIARYQNVSDAPSCTNLRPYGRVIVVLAQSSYLTDGDVATAVQSIDSIRSVAPETRIIYVTSSEDAKSFNQLERQWPSNSATVSADNLYETVSGISKELRRLPASIINFYCNVSKSNFEDYLTPDLTSLYEINAEYVAAANISVKFQTKGYGDISICVYEATSMLTNKTCKHVTVNDEVTFKIEDHCSRDSACSVQFAVSPNSSALKCSAFDCRYPDQVLINIETTWRNSSPTHLITSWSLFVVIALLFM